MANEIPNLEALEGTLRSTWSGRDSHIREMRTLRYMEDTVQAPAHMEAEVIQVPAAWTVIERMVGTLTTDAPLITVPPIAATQAAQRQSGKMEKWTQSMLSELARQAEEDVVEKYIECLVADGHACMRMLYAPQLWAGYPKRRKEQEDQEYSDEVEAWKIGRPIPIAWQWVDPLTVYPMWSEGGLEAILEVDERDVLALDQRRWNMGKRNPEITELMRVKMSNGDRVKFAQLWTRDTLTYAVEDKVVHHSKHTYGRPPYVYSFGTNPATREPDKMGLSTLFPLRYVLPQLNRVLSQKATAVRMWAWPTPIYQLSDRSALDPNGQPRDLVVEPGTTVVLWPGETLTWLAWSGNGPDIDEMIQIIMSFVERAGISDVLYGSAGSGDSGYLVNQLIQAARMKFKPLVDHAERGLEQMIKVLWDIVEFQCKQPLYVYNRESGKEGWMGLGPEDLNGARQVYVTLQPVMPTDAYAKTSQAINEVGAQLRSRRSAMEMIGVEQPEEMLDEIRVEEWEKTPEVQAFLTAEAVRRAKIKIQEQQAPAMTPEMLQQILPSLPPALQQAIMAGQVSPEQLAMMMQQGGMMGQNPPGPGQGIMAAPGVPAIPQTPAQPPPQVGPAARPSGIATGRAPGVKRRGNER